MLPSSTTKGRRALDSRHLQELYVLPPLPEEVLNCSKVAPFHLRALPSEFGPGVGRGRCFGEEGREERYVLAWRTGSR